MIDMLLLCVKENVVGREGRGCDSFLTRLRRPG